VKKLPLGGGTGNMTLLIVTDSVPTESSENGTKTHAGELSMSELKYVGPELPSTGVGRPGELKLKVEDWVPKLMADPGNHYEAEHRDKQVYGRANSIRAIFAERPEPGKFEVSVRRDKLPEGVDWKENKPGTIYVRYLTPKMVSDQTVARKKNGSEQPEVGDAPEPVNLQP
jgi:hypothetical protein